MMDSAKICALGVICAIICVIIKHNKNEFVIPTRISSLVVIFGVLIAMLSPIFEFIRGLMGQTLTLEYMEIIVKALGIAYLTQISAELCRDCDENNIAMAIETAGKLEIIMISLPLINKILQMSEEMLSW